MPTRRKRKPTPPKPARPREEWYAGQVLALDPSTRAIGAALFDNGELEAVRLFTAANKDGKVRVRRMLNELIVAFDEIADLDAVVVEVGAIVYSPSYGKVGPARRNRGVRAKDIITLSLHQGWFIGQLEAFWHDIPFHTVPAHEWTREIPKEARRKEQRAKALAKECKLYRSVAAHDKGFDVADAIGVGRYFLSHYNA
jgi:hypothetical protein